MPSLRSSNHFSILAIDEDFQPLRGAENDEDAQPPKTPPPAATRAPRLRQLRWENWMHERLVINNLDEGLRCILILVHLKTMDTMQELNSEAMVDCGATGDFVDEEFVKRANLLTPCLHPSPSTMLTVPQTRLVTSVRLLTCS